MATSSFSRCPECNACPEVDVRTDEVRIGEADNLVVLKKAEWNVLVELISASSNDQRKDRSRVSWLRWTRASPFNGGALG